MTVNEIGILGFDFIEFSAIDGGPLKALFKQMGMTCRMKHHSQEIYYFNQSDIHFLLNLEPSSHAKGFAVQHGPCASAMGWRVANAQKAYDLAIQRGANPAKGCDYSVNGAPLLAIEGVGESTIYLVDQPVGDDRWKAMGFEAISNPEVVPPMGFALVDHLTNNVYQGRLEPLAQFYKDVFEFTEVRHFDIDGRKTGLLSYALRSPCGSFCIPINESKDEKSQIKEYLDEYRGEGIQHIALLTSDLVKTMENMGEKTFDTLDIDSEYYDGVFDRVPGIREDKSKIQKFNLLVDGDETGYLIQIFTRNVIGPIFFEFIQRRNHLGFGEGNFGALFRAMEKDQERRGVL